MDNEIKKIFNQVIDKYESSKKFINDIEGNIIIYLKDNPIYDESLNLYKINEELNELKRLNNLEIVWFERNNIIDKIKIKTSNIEFFYEITGRVNKKDIIENYKNIFKNKLKEFRVKWIREYIYDQINTLNNNKIPKNINKYELIFEALNGIEDIEINELDDMLIRVFSKKYLKNSKVFANEVSSIIISILKKYNSNVDEVMEDEAALEEVGIIKTTNDLYVKGDIRINVDGEIINLKKFKYGIGLNKDMIKNSNIIAVGEIKEVISIENKANFLSEKYDDSKLVVFSHGYFSPWKRKFLLMLKEYLYKDTEYYHSGDIDLGGLNIFKHIKKHLFPQLQPLNMDKNIYIKYLEYGEVKSDVYLKKLNNINLEEFDDLINLMQEKKVVLEQESFLIDI